MPLCRNHLNEGWHEPAIMFPQNPLKGLLCRDTNSLFVHVCVCVGDTAEGTSAGYTASALPKLHWTQPQEVPLWDISNCILEDGQILISPEEEVSTLTQMTRNLKSTASS